MKRKARRWYACDAEYALVEAAAADHGRPVAEYVRACVMADTKRHLHRTPSILEAIRMIVREEIKGVKATLDRGGWEIMPCRDSSAFPTFGDDSGGKINEV